MGDVEEYRRVMRFGSWRDIPRGLWWGSAIGVGFVLAQFVEQWWRTGHWGSR